MGQEQSSGNAGDALNSREVATMDSEVRRKLLASHGTRYNMKVVLRGDRNTGKTQLWRRLQGQSFSSAYSPTEQIQVATINWDYKATSDVVKVEVWDVVDKGKKKKKHAGLKIANGIEEEDEDEEEEEKETTKSQTPNSPIPTPTPQQANPNSHDQQQNGAVCVGSFTVATLDATTVDVMRGATGVVFVFDITKKWTWDYVVRELPAAASTGVHILVVANFRDMGENRVITRKEAETHCKATGENIQYIEASMKNAYGVKAIAAFFNLPFLYLQKQAIQAELKRNESETHAVREELQVLSEELTWETYLKSLADKRSAAKSHSELPQVTTTAEKTQEKQPQQEKATEKQPTEKPITTTQPVQVPEKPKEEEKVEIKSAPSRGDPTVTIQAINGGGFASSLRSLILKRNEQQPQTAEDQKEKEKKEREEKEKQIQVQKAKEKEAAAKKAEEEKKRTEEEKKKKNAEKNKKNQTSKSKPQTVVAPEEVDAVEELKKLAKQKATPNNNNNSNTTNTSAVADAESFKPSDDLDDSFFGGSGSGNNVTDDGWIVPSSSTTKARKANEDVDDDDGWGGSIGGNSNDKKEEKEKEKPQTTTTTKKTKKAAMFLADVEEPE